MSSLAASSPPYAKQVGSVVSGLTGIRQAKKLVADRPEPTIGMDALTTPSVTPMVPLTPVVSVGPYCTVSVQLCPGARAAVQVFPTRATCAAPCPVRFTLGTPLAVAPALVTVTVLTAESWFTNTEPKLTEVGFITKAVPVTMAPVTVKLTAPLAAVTVKAAEMRAGAAPAAGVNRRPIVQVSAWSRVVLVAQVLLEMVMLVGGVTATVSAPEGVAEVLVTVKTTSAPMAPGATDPRAGPPASVKVLLVWSMPLRATVATEAPTPRSVTVRVPVTLAVAVAAGE